MDMLAHVTESPAMQPLPCTWRHSKIERYNVPLAQALNTLFFPMILHTGVACILAVAASGLRKRMRRSTCARALRVTFLNMFDRSLRSAALAGGSQGQWQTLCSVPAAGVSSFAISVCARSPSHFCP
jgi:hypothetical protein